MFRYSSTNFPNQENCQVCHGTGWILSEDDPFAVVGRCDCVQRDRDKVMVERSGYAGANESYSLSNYRVGNNETIQAKTMCYDYIKHFTGNLTERNNSLLLLGQVGAGKTHLAVAVSKELMIQYRVSVLYMPYREEITKLKQLVNDDIAYQKALKEYKSAGLLYIDDLFKGGVSEADIRHMFTIIDYRYRNRLPMIVNSEHLIPKLMEIDEAIASRLVEASRGHIITFTNPLNNYRMGN